MQYTGIQEVPMMSRNLMRNGLVLLAACCAAMPPACAKNKPAPRELPKPVMDALTARFPGAEISEWDREKEGDAVVYDIEFEQDGRKFEADIGEDGTIDNWEMEVTVTDLPDEVRKVVAAQYPRTTIEEAMAITSNADGEDVFDGYEILLQTADGKKTEIMVSPEGELLDESDEDE